MPQHESSIQVIKDAEVVTDRWQVVGLDANIGQPQSDWKILPLDDYLAHGHVLLGDSGQYAVWLSGEEPLEAHMELLLGLPLIAVYFPAFTDGRGFSLATLLRERYGYQGELRAIGEILPDQLFYLRRCGFSSFSFALQTDLQDALNSLADFSDSYQQAVD